MHNLHQRCNKHSRPLGRRGRTLAYLSLFSLVSVAASGRIEAQGVAISALPDASSANATDMIPCVQGGVTRRCTPAEFLALLTGGVGISISSQTISTASSEADFLSSGALTCGASTQGKVQVHSTTPLQYCDNASTPTLRYAAYGNAAGECLAVAENSILLTTNTVGNYATSNAEGGPALSGDSASAFFPLGQVEPARGGTGIDTSASTGVPRIAGGAWAISAGISHLALSSSSDLRGVLFDETGSGSAVFATSPVFLTDVLLDAEAELRFGEADVNGSNYVAIKAPAALTSNVTCTLEDDNSPIPDSCIGNGVDDDDQTASEVAYTPIDGADWANPDPDDVADGLDKLADRLTVEEAKADDDIPESGDFGALALTGPVTSSGVATSIVNDAITEPMLKSVNAPTDELCLSYESTTGDFEWQACGSVNSFETITPTLGTSPVADSPTDTLNLVCGGGVTCTGSAAPDEINFAVLSTAENFLQNGGATNLVCIEGGGSGRMQVTDNGRLQYCDGSDSLQSGYLDADGTDDDLPDADEIVESMLKAVDSATDEECLTFETTTGDFEWQACGAGGSTPAGSGSELQYRVDGSTFGAVSSSSISGANITLGGTLSGATQLNVDNLRLDGNVLSSTDTNGNITLTPNGSGIVDASGTYLQPRNNAGTAFSNPAVYGIRFGASASAVTISGKDNTGIIVGTADGTMKAVGASNYQGYAGTGGNRTVMLWGDAGTPTVAVNSSGTFGFSSGSDAAGGQDTILSRGSAAVVKIDDAIRLDVIASPPVTCGDANTQGTIYNDSSVALCWCDGTAWQKLSGGGTCA